MIRIQNMDRDFIINPSEILCIIPDESGEEAYLIVFRTGDKFPISGKEYLQISEAIAA